MKVSTILSTKPSGIITIQPTQTIKEAATLLTNHNIGAVIVQDAAQNLVGILSERDIIHLISQHDESNLLPVSSAMTTDVITGSPSDDLMSLANTMTEKRFRHMPIVRDNELMGMISIGDIVKVQRDQYRGERNTLETQILAE